MRTQPGSSSTPETPESNTAPKAPRSAALAAKAPRSAALAAKVFITETVAEKDAETVRDIVDLFSDVSDPCDPEYVLPKEPTEDSQVCSVSIPFELEAL